MPQCRGCGNQVSQKFADVMWKDNEDTVPACPNCDDSKLMDGQKKVYRK